MTRQTIIPSRRAALTSALALPLAAALTRPALAQSSQPQGSPMSDPLHFTGSPADFDFLVGSWKVRHHRATTRLAGPTTWQDFDGTCVNWPTMGGAGNVDDNMLELPAGTYRAVGMRAYDPAKRQWSIWWLDARTPEIDPPVRGGFTDGVGTFIGDDVYKGQAIKVRFRWSEITADTAKWDQAFSPDGGKTWETNWRMEFQRVPA